MGESYNLACSG